MSILRIPGSALKVTAQFVLESISYRSIHKAPRRISQSGARIQQTFRTAKICLAKAVRAIQRNRHGRHLNVPAQHRSNRPNRRITPRLRRNHLRRIRIQPEAIQFVRSASENQDRPARHPPHFREPSFQIRPLMHSKGRHAAVEDSIAKWQLLRNRIDGSRQVSRPLRPHRV